MISLVRLTAVTLASTVAALTVTGCGVLSPNARDFDTYGSEITRIDMPDGVESVEDVDRYCAVINIDCEDPDAMVTAFFPEAMSNQQACDSLADWAVANKMTAMYALNEDTFEPQEDWDHRKPPKKSARITSKKSVVKECVAATEGFEVPMSSGYAYAFAVGAPDRASRRAVLTGSLIGTPGSEELSADNGWAPPPADWEFEARLSSPGDPAEHLNLDDE